MARRSSRASEGVSQKSVDKTQGKERVVLRDEDGQILSPQEEELQTDASSLPEDDSGQHHSEQEGSEQENIVESVAPPVELGSYLEVLALDDEGADADERFAELQLSSISGVDRLGANLYETDTTDASGRVSAASDSSGSSGGTTSTSGLNPYSNDSGQLIPGVPRYPDLPSFEMQWDSTPPHIFDNGVPLVDGSGQGKEQPRQYAKISGGGINESSEFLTFSLEADLFSGDGVLSFSIGDGTASQGVHYEMGLEWFNGTAWVALSPTATGGNEFSVPVVNGFNEFQFRLPLVDNHLTHSDKHLDVTITGYTVDSGVMVPVHELTDSPATHLVIGDDRTDTLKDGPVVSIQSIMPEGQGIVEGETHTFTLVLQDKDDTSRPYEGDAVLAGNSLPQDLTVTLRFSGTAKFDSDYKCEPNASLQALIDAGKVTDFSVNPNGTITLTLKGLYDANGNPHPAGTPHLELSDIADVKLDFDFHATPDDIQPVRDIQIDIVSVAGNEALIGTGDSTSIHEDPEGFRGPQLSLNQPTAKEGSTPTENFTRTTHVIELKAPPYATLVQDGKNPGDPFPAEEEIRITIKLTGQNGAVLGDINSLHDEDDFALDTLSIKYFDDTTATWNTLPTSNYLYNSSTGELSLTIPEGAQKIAFDVCIMDDKRENEGTESYDVTLGLVYENGVSDALATIADVLVGEEYTQNIIIVEETRPDSNVSDALNPPHFDGPHLWFTSDKTTVLEGDKVQYTLTLTDPDSTAPSVSDTRYNADEAVNLTIKVSFSTTTGFQPHDLVFYDADHRPVAIGSEAELKAHTGPLYIKTAADTFTEITVDPTGSSFTFSQTIEAGQSQCSFDLEVRDDVLGGVKDTHSLLPPSTNDLAREPIDISIVGLGGNETRYDSRHADNAHSVAIVDDGETDSHQGGELDGPQIDIAFGSTEDFISSSENTATVREDTAVSVTFTPRGQVGETGILEEPLRLLVTITGPDTSFDLKDPHGRPLTPVTGSPGQYIITIPQGTDISNGYTVTFDANDSDTNTADRDFTIELVDVAGSESTTAGGSLALTVTVKEAFTPANGSLTLIDTSGETIDQINESDQSEDTWTSTADNFMYAKVDIVSDSTSATPTGAKLHFENDVTFTLSMKPSANAPSDNEDPQIATGQPSFDTNPTLDTSDDIYWAAFKSWALVLDGEEYTVSSFIPPDVSSGVASVGSLVFMVGDKPFTVNIDSIGAGGQDIVVTIPKSSIGDNQYASVSLKVGVGIHDDLFEEKQGEFVDFAIAFSNNVNSVQNSGSSLEIVADERPDDVSEQPLYMDGPFVSLSRGEITRGGEADGEVVEGGSVAYTIQLTNPDGTPAIYTDAPEDITISFKVSGGEGFSLGDLFKPDANGNINETITCETSPTVSQAPTITITGNVNAPEGTFTVTIPKGVGELEFTLPINDDMVGGAHSSLDRPREDMTLEITKIEGSEARLEYTDGAPQGYTDTVTIIDDNTDNFLQVGLVWKNSIGSAIAGAENTINEGTTGNFGFTLLLKDGKDGKDGKALSSTNNPYKGYSGVNNTFPEDLVISLHFGENNTADGDDMHLRASTYLIGLVKAGKVKIFGTDEQGARMELSGDELKVTDLAGDFDIVLVGEKFLFSDLSSLTVNAHAHGDRSNEYDKDKDYLVEKDAIDEAFGISIKKVEGNESVVHNGKGALSGTITDVASGTIGFSDESGTFVSTGNNDFGRWEFTVNVKYDPTERENIGEAFSAGAISGTAVASVPTEDITFAIKISDSLVFQQGEEYVVSAYSLFLSINNLSKSDVSESAYEAFIAGGSQPDGWDAGWAVVEQTGAWESMGLDNLPKASSAEFTIDVPVKFWESHSDGAINFAIDQHRNVGGKQNNTADGFKVEIVNPKVDSDGNSLEYDVKGEIVTVDDEPVYGGFPPSKLGLNLTGTPTITEDDKGNIATYNMSFSYFLNKGSETAPNYQVVDDGESFYAASALSFTFLLTPGSASFNEDTINNTDYAEMGDFAMAYKAEDGSFKVLEYDRVKGGETSLEYRLNEYLFDKFGKDASDEPMVSVILAKKGNSYEFRFTVKEGVDLREGIDLHFIAMDDNIADSGESFSGKIYDVKSENDIVNATIEKNEASTTINDELDPNFSGFAIALADGHGYELTLEGKATDAEGIPFDGKVHVPVYAYILGNNAGIGEESGILSLSYLKELFVRSTNANKDPSAVGNEDSDFLSWIATNFKPTQPINLSYTLKDTDDAKVEVDYKFDNSATISSDDWVLVIDGDKIYYEAEFTVETINDFLDMGGTDIHFDIVLDTTNGNESRPVRDDDKTHIDDNHTLEVNGFIKDFHDGPQVLFVGRNDGTGKISITEPTDINHGPVDGDEHKADPTLGTFTVQLSDVVKQDTIVWLAVGGGSATEGEDFTFGQGMYKVVKNGEVISYETYENGQLVTHPYADLVAKYPYLNTEPEVESHFVIVREGQSSVDLEIRILDDNKDEGLEDFTIAVENVEGGEATYLVTGADGHSYKIPWNDAMPFKYSVMYEVGGASVATTVIIDPAKKVVLDMTGNKLEGFDWDNMEAWYPTQDKNVNCDKLQSTIEIEDDGFGPIVGIDISKTSWDEGEKAPSFTVKLQDYCQDDVSVDVRMEFLDGIAYTFTLTIPEGKLEKEFTAKDVYDAFAEAYEKEYGTTAPDELPRGSFYLTTPQSQGGETQPSEDVLFYPVPVDDYHEVYVWNFRPVKVTEGDTPGTPGDPCRFEINLYIPDNKKLAIKEGGSFTIKVPDSDHLSGGGREITVSFTKDQLEALQTDPQAITPEHPFSGQQYTIVLTDDGQGNVTATLHDWEYDHDVNGVAIDGPGTIGPEIDMTGKTPPTVSVNPAPGAGEPALPSAVGDTVMGDDVTLGIDVGVGGSIHYTPSQPSKGSITIQDNTRAKVVFAMYDADSGKWKIIDGTTFSEDAGNIELKAFLALTDKDGKFIDNNGAIIDNPQTLDVLTGATATKELVFDIQYTPVGEEGAELNQDFTGDSTVSIKAGQSSGSFNIVITDDALSEPDESFTISLKPTEDTTKGCKEILQQLEENDAGDYGSGAVTIEDNLSGPAISWSANTTSVAENGTITLAIESHQGGSRQVVSEDVELTFIMEPKNGFSVEEIKSISYNGKTYTWDGPVGSNLNELFQSNSDNTTWTLTLPAGMPGAKGLNNITIALLDDVITEGNEHFSLKLEKVHGGETSSATPGVTEFTVTDTLDGPTLALVAGTGSEENRDLGAGKDVDGNAIEASGKFVDYKITLSGGKSTGEDAKITLTITPEAVEHVNENGSFFIKLPGGEYVEIPKDASTSSPHYYDAATGQIVITLPEGSKGGTDIEVYIPIKDNSTIGDRDFGLTMSHDGRGEITSDAGFSYSSAFVAETAPTPTNGGSNTYRIFTGDSAVSETTASLSITVNGIYKSTNGVHTIKTIALGGKTLVEGPDWHWNSDDSSITITLGKGPLFAEAELFIEYNNGAEASALEQTKSNISIGNIEIGGREVTTVIKDEPASGDVDGPLASIVFGDGVIEVVDDKMSIVEGNNITGAITITLPVLPGDTNTTAEDLFITMKVSPATSLKAFAESLKGLDLGYMVVEGNDGTLTIGIDAGTTLTENGDAYELSIPFEVNVPDTPLSQKDSISFEITKVEGNDSGTVHYETINHDDARHTIEVKADDASLSGPNASLTIDPSVEEGGTFAGTLTVKIPQVSENITTTQEVTTITLSLSGDIDWSSFSANNPDFTVVPGTNTGKVTVTIPTGKTIPSGGFEVHFTAQTPDNSIAGENPNVSVTIESITGSKGLYEQYTGAGEDSKVEITVTDSPAGFEQGPEASLVITSGVGEDGKLTEGTDLKGNVSLSLPVLAGDGNTLIEDLTITLKLSPAERLDDLEWGNSIAPITDIATGEVKITIPAGTELVEVDGQYTYDIGFTLPVADTALAEKGTIKLEITDIQGGTGEPHYERIDVDTANANSGEIQIVPTDTLDAVVVEISADTTSLNETNLIFDGSIAVQLPHGENAPDEVPDNITIELAVSGIEGFTMSGLDTTYYEIDTSDLDSGIVTVTIKEGVTVPAGGLISLDYCATMPQGSGIGATCSIKITGISGPYEGHIVNNSEGIVAEIIDPAPVPFFLMSFSADADMGLIPDEVADGMTDTVGAVEGGNEAAMRMAGLEEMALPFMLLSADGVAVLPESIVAAAPSASQKLFAEETAFLTPDEVPGINEAFGPDEVSGLDELSGLAEEGAGEVFVAGHEPLPFILPFADENLARYAEMQEVERGGQQVAAGSATQENMVFGADAENAQFYEDGEGASLFDAESMLDLAGIMEDPALWQRAMSALQENMAELQGDNSLKDTVRDGNPLENAALETVAPEESNLDTTLLEAESTAGGAGVNMAGNDLANELEASLEAESKDYLDALSAKGNALWDGGACDGGAMLADGAVTEGTEEALKAFFMAEFG